MSGTPADMQAIVREIAEAQQAPTIQRAIDLAAGAIGLTYSRAFSLYYAQARSVRAEEWIAAQKAMMQTRRARAVRLRAELAALENTMGGHDADLETGDRMFSVDRRSRARCGAVLQR